MAAHVLYYMLALFVYALVSADMAYRLLRVRLQLRFVPTTFFATIPQAYAAEPFLIGMAQPTHDVVDQHLYVKS